MTDNEIEMSKQIELLKFTMVLQSLVLRKYNHNDEADFFHHGIMWKLKGTAKERFSEAKKILGLE